MLYNKLRQQAIVSIDEALKRDFKPSSPGTYVNILQQIESLRLVYNLGLHYHMRHCKVSQASREVDNWASIAYRTRGLQCAAGDGAIDLLAMFVNARDRGDTSRGPNCHAAEPSVLQLPDVCLRRLYAKDCPNRSHPGVWSQPRLPHSTRLHKRQRS